jgi:hypothetical protein
MKIKELGKGIFDSKKRGLSDEKIAVIISASAVAWEQFKNICNLQYLY